MKKLYITVGIVAVLIVVLFVGSFFLIDKIRHSTFYYEILVNDSYAGMVRIDRYATEDSIVYKSSSKEPFSIGMTRRNAKLVLDGKYTMQLYSELGWRENVSESVKIVHREGTLSYICVSGPSFMFQKNIQIKTNSLPFIDTQLITYKPFLENYDFFKGRSAAFRAAVQTSPMLPPMKTILTLTSIRDEYLTIGRRKIKTECLLLKIRGRQQIVIWVSKLDHSIIALEVPDKDIRFVRSFRGDRVFSKIIDEAPRPKTTDQDITFMSGKVSLAGKLSVPQGTGALPAVLLIAGPGSYDASYAGLYADIAEYLSGNGMCVLRFNKRGIAGSKGSFMTYAESDELSDIESALAYLGSLDRVDKNKIVLVGHSLGGYYALKITAQHNEVRACVVLAMPFYVTYDRWLREAIVYSARISKWSDAYIEQSMNAAGETCDFVRNSAIGWPFVLGKRCFLKRIQEQLNDSPPAAIKDVSVPVLILHGNKDDVVPPEHAQALSDFLEASGNKLHKIVYFGYLGHFFGPLTFDKKTKMRYAADQSFMQTMGQWILETANTQEPAEPTGVQVNEQTGLEAAPQGIDEPIHNQ